MLYLVSYVDSRFGEKFGKKNIEVSSVSSIMAIEKAMHEVAGAIQNSDYDESAEVVDNKVIVYEEGLEAYTLVNFEVVSKSYHEVFSDYSTSEWW